MPRTWGISRKGSTASETPSAPPRRASSRTDRDSGLSVLYPGKEPIVADLIAVHGLNGHRERTWSETSSGVNWLQTILPKDLPDVRILTYGYNSRTHGSEQLIARSLYDHGETFVQQLCAYRRYTKTEKRPIIFLAHSLGGIVVKAALIHSSLPHKDNQGDIKRSTYGLVFCGTPHGGSSIASLGTKLLHLLSPFARTNILVIRHLQQDSEWLRMQHKQFASISREFEITNFFETYPTHIALGRGIIIVSQSSATLVGDRSVGLGKTHTELVRFEDKDDPAYLLIRDALQALRDKAPKETDISSGDSSAPATTLPGRMGGALSTAALGTKPESSDVLGGTAGAPTSDMIALPFSLPVQQNPGFVGRESQLKKLNELLSKSGETRPSTGSPQPRVAVLFGMGGAGKTQLSIAFAESHKKDFDVVLWIDASSERNTLTSFRAFAQRLLDSKTDESARKGLLAKLNLGEYVTSTGHFSSNDNDLPKVAKHVLDLLQSEDEAFEWLMVMDNLDDQDYPVSTYLPKTPSRGTVIITTRSTPVTRSGEPIEIAEIDEESGVQILLNAAYMRIKTDTDNEDARSIVKSLGFLPLALEHAGAYITKTQMRLSKYLEILERRQRELANYPGGASISADQKAVFATFEVSFPRLDEDAAALLTLMSFLHNSSVWEGLLVPASELGHRPQRQNSEMGSTQTRGPVRNDRPLPRVYTNEDELEDVLAEIFSVSLAKRDARGTNIYIHPLVHAWGRKRLPAENQLQNLEQAVNIVGRALEAAYIRPMTKEVRRYIARVVPHADQVISLITQHGQYARDEIIFPNLLKSPVSARALFYLGVLFQNISRLKEAEAIFTSIIAGTSSTEGIITPVMGANARRRLAQITILFSRYDEAENLLQVAIPVLELHLGKRHEDTVTAMLELGMVYHRRHEYSRAETQLSETIKHGTNPMTGKMSRAAREASSILGLVYRHMGQLKDALDVLTPALEQALSAGKSMSKPPHTPLAVDSAPKCEVVRRDSFQPPTSPKSHGQDDTGSSDEEDDETEEEEPDDQSLAHLPTLQYRHAIVLQELGLWTVAMEDYQTVYASLSSILGTNNPLTLRTANALGRIYCFLGHYKESRDMLDIAWKGQLQLGFSKEAETAQLRTLFNIGVLNREEGLYEAALDCLGRVEVAYQRLFGQSEPGDTTTNEAADGAEPKIPKLKFPVQNVMLEKAITLTYMARYSSPMDTVPVSPATSVPSVPTRTRSIHVGRQSSQGLKEERLDEATRILTQLLASQEEHDKVSILEHITTRTALAEAYLEYHTPDGLKKAEEVIRPAKEYVTSRGAQLAGMEADNPIRLKVELVVVEILLEGKKYLEAVEWMTNGETHDHKVDMITRLEKAFGNGEHQLVLRGKVLLAKGYNGSGKKDEAKKIAKEVGEVLEKTLGRPHYFTKEVLRLAKTWDPLAFPGDDGARGDGDGSDDEGGNSGTKKGRFGLRKKVLAVREAF